MNIEDIKFKLKLIENEIEATKEIYEFNKKMNRIMLIIEVFILIITLFLCGNTSNLNIWQIFNTSLLACVFYNSLSDIVTEKSDYKAKLNKLELKRMYHTSLLDKNE